MSTDPGRYTRLPLDLPIWDRFFLPAPLVLVGTLDADGTADLAPKHMALPMGWDNYFGFVCTPRHATYRNAVRGGGFAVSFPRPDQLLYTSLAASPRCDADAKPVLDAFTTLPAGRVAGVLIAEAYVHLECELFKVVDGFGVNSLMTGRVVDAQVERAALRVSDVDDQDLLRAAPLLAYLYPGRFATLADTRTFPMPAGMRR